MAITDTIQAKEFEAGAPNIILKGDLRPNQMMAGYLDPMSEKNDMAMEMFGKQLKDLTDSELELLDEEIDRLRSKFMADGGRAQYGLGSFVKSVGKGIKGAVKGVAKGVKSIAKSDLGKAALAAAALYYGGPRVKGFFEGMSLPSLPTFGLSKKGQGTLASFAIGSLGSAALSAAEAGGLDSSDPNAEVDLDSLTGYLTRGYKNLNPNATDEEVFQFVQENTAEYRAMGGRIGYASGSDKKMMIVDMLNKGMDFDLIKKLTKASDKEMGEAIDFFKYGGAGVPLPTFDESGKMIDDGLYKGRETRPEAKANGGRISYAMGTDEKVEMAAGIEGLPVRQNKAGVKELDLRETGGFIQPVGIKEKADDIPAMLSNNEFVFTADAVRAAGGGNINKGAQVMYDTMKKLESKVV